MNIVEESGEDEAAKETSFVILCDPITTKQLTTKGVIGRQTGGHTMSNVAAIVTTIRTSALYVATKVLVSADHIESLRGGRGSLS